MKTPDPRVMIFTSVCFSTLALLIDQIWLLVLIFVCSILFNLLVGIDMIQIARKIWPLFPIFFVIAVLQSVFDPYGQVLISIGNISLLTSGGLTQGILTLLRMSVVMSAAVIFSLTDYRRMAQGLVQLKIPYELAFMALIALRFLPVLKEEFQDTLLAIQLRGVDIGTIKLKDKLKMFVSILSPVVYRAVDKAQHLSWAMELKAFRLYPKRTSRIILKLSFTDALYLIVFSVCSVGLLYYYYRFI